MERSDFKSRFSGLCSGLADEDVDAMIASLKVRALVQGDRLVEEGEPSGRAWLIHDGIVGVTVKLAHRTVSLGRIGSGAIVGEVAFVDGGPASATGTAQGPVTVFELTRASVLALQASNPSAAAALNRAICDALGRHLVAATDKLQALRAGRPGQARLDEIEGESLLDALRELLGLGRR